jgi:hypothetical protein
LNIVNNEVTKLDKFPTTGNPLIDWAIFALVCIGAALLLRIGGWPEPVEVNWDEKEDKKS